ncbi:MAG: protein kinase, partial [Polyangiales bacterium]
MPDSKDDRGAASSAPSTLASGDPPDLALARTVRSDDGANPHAATISSDARSLPAVPMLRVGDVLGGRYELLEILGRGGQGVVWRAHDRHADANVALKLLVAEASGNKLKRFRRELALARKVTHPCVVRIYDLVELKGGFALSMELVDGVALERVLHDRGPLSEDRLVALALDLSSALAAAHEAGVIHRDLKPANVLIRASSGRALITDFGVSRLRDHVAEGIEEAGEIPSRKSAPGVTEEGALVGTPQYMAPEQLQASPRLGPQVDVYAFGMVMFEAATGKPLHDASSIAALTRTRLAGPAPPIASVRAGLPELLTSAIDRALSIDPAARFPDGMELANALAPLDLSHSVRRTRSLAPPPMAPSIAPPSPPSTKKSTFRFAVPLSLLGVVLVGAAVIRTRPSRSPVATTPAPIAATSASTTALRFSPSHPRRLTFNEGCEEFPAFHPNDAQVVYDGTDGPNSAIIVRDLATGASRALTKIEGWDIAPAVSPDGKTIAFLRLIGGRSATYAIDFHGLAAREATPRLLLEGNVRPSFSPEGRSIWVGPKTHPERRSLE